MHSTRQNDSSNWTLDSFNKTYFDPLLHRTAKSNGNNNKPAGSSYQ